MDTTRELKFQKINRYFTLGYILLSVVLCVVHVVKADMYHLGITIGTFFIPPALALFYRIFGLHRAHQLDFLVLAFSLLAYTLGACAEFYLSVPHYDKVMHTLSGGFVSLLCLALYYAVKPGHKVERSDCALAALFVFFGSMAVAGLWEIGEYFVNLITGIDVQRTLTTGINDTMQDMIVCLIGTLLTLPAVVGLCRGKQNVFTGSVTAFIANNADRLR